MSAYLDILAAGTAERHRAQGLGCTCGEPVWTEYHQAVMVGRAIAVHLADEAEKAGSQS